MRDRIGLVVTLGFGIALLGGCASDPHGGAVSNSKAVRIHNGSVAVEAMPGLDRYTYFGPVSGPNMLMVESLGQAPLEEEAYTFYGGAYTWVAPQKKGPQGTPGWIGPEGELRDWPPDPAMDVGPAKVMGKTDRSITTRTPTSRQGLRERKRFELTGPMSARLAYTLENHSHRKVTAAPWVNTAVPAGAVVAVPFVEGRDGLWGWDQESIDRFRSILRPDAASGWSLVELPSANWQGGGKVYLDCAPRIAIWHEGYWLVRDADHTGAQRLRSLGEGPVAMYIDPGDGTGTPVIEAELYGEPADLLPFNSTTTTEHWTLIEAAEPDLGLLPE